MLTGFQFYKIHTSLQLHFNSKLNYLKYGASLKKLTIDSFNKRNDRLRFDSYASKLNNEHEAMQFCVANFVHNDEKWIYKEYGESESVYRNWKKYFSAFAYNFTGEFKTLQKIQADKSITFNKMLEQTPSGGQPPLLQLALHGMLSPEFIVTLDSKFSFITKWKDIYKDVDPFIEKKLSILTNYEPICILISKEQM